jgi:hypothetical protein
MGNATASVSLQITARDVLTSGLKAGVIPIQFAQAVELNNGLLDSQIDLAWSASRVAMPASATTNMDLHGALTDSFGNTVQFHAVVLIALRNNRTTALANLTLAPAAANGFGRLASGLGFWPADIAADADQGNVVSPGGWLVLYAADGVPVTAGTADILSITTSGVTGSTNAWDILILGRSA